MVEVENSLECNALTTMSHYGHLGRSAEWCQGCASQMNIAYCHACLPVYSRWARLDYVMAWPGDAVVMHACDEVSRVV
jgi:hypothetical protein